CSPDHFAGLPVDHGAVHLSLQLAPPAGCHWRARAADAEVLRSHPVGLGDVALVLLGLDLGAEHVSGRAVVERVVPADLTRDDVLVDPWLAHPYLQLAKAADALVAVEQLNALPLRERLALGDLDRLIHAAA